MSRILRFRKSEESGFTLVEVTLTALILGLVMMMAFDFLDRVSLLTVRTQANAQTEQDAQLALRVVSEHLRGAAPIGDACSPALDTSTATTLQVVPGPLPTGYKDCVQFKVKRTETGLDTCAETHFVFALVGTGSVKKLIENRLETDGVTGSCVTGTWRNRRVLLDKVVNNPGTEPLFRYYKPDGTEINTADAAAVKKATSVHIRLDVKFQNNANESVFSTSAALRNNVPR